MRPSSKFRFNSFVATLPVTRETHHRDSKDKKEGKKEGSRGRNKERRKERAVRWIVSGQFFTRERSAGTSCTSSVRCRDNRKSRLRLSRGYVGASVTRDERGRKRNEEAGFHRGPFYRLKNERGDDRKGIEAAKLVAVSGAPRREKHFIIEKLRLNGNVSLFMPAVIVVKVKEAVARAATTMDKRIY